ncbi:MAG TPA: hypothetical protein VMF88_06030 [Bacteroidota bacterium]|nr:hypothetical protein [Bacteroidota bacterium]
MSESRFSKFFADRQQALVIFSAVAGIAVVHTPAQFVEDWLLRLPPPLNLALVQTPQFAYAVNAVRGTFFLFASGILLYFFAMPVVDFFSSANPELDFGKILKNTAVVFICCGALVIPAKLGIMGVGYGEMSKDPFHFLDASDQIYQRLLMPAAAFFFQLRGPLLYHLFSLSLTFCLIFFTLLFFEVQGIRTSLLERISIATTTFIITQFQSPGYTEQLALLIVLIVVIVPMGALPKIAAVTLALFAHEVSALLFIVLALVSFTKGERLWVGTVLVVYISFWLMSFGFNVSALSGVRSVGGFSGFAWLNRHPLREVGGIAVSYKLLWVVFAAALIFKGREAKRLLLFLLPGIVATVFGVDTSRLMAFSFLAILFALMYVKRHALFSERVLQLLLGLNLCLPSVYIGLNSGLVYFDGLYQLIYRGYLFK